DGRRDGQLSLGEGIDVRAWVKVQTLTPDDLKVELIYGEEKNEHIATPRKLPMGYVRQEEDGSYRYEIHLQPEESGSIAYGVRVLPTHPALAGKHEMGLMRWACVPFYSHTNAPQKRGCLFEMQKNRFTIFLHLNYFHVFASTRSQFS